MIRTDKYDLIFWDFDGVIKESVSVKTDAYVKLFKPYGSDVCKQVKNHHLANGGMSRFNKIPLYLKWVGLEQNDAEVQNGTQDFLAKYPKKYTILKEVVTGFNMHPTFWNGFILFKKN